ncbi:hypothetical protein MUGA111182_09640 [Mucilaginibacter galii]|uniref:DUF4177 domain-containing protein n=1 Tax=Mucilaginibacter galii TaxID=2005073 RepID=A0A917J9Z0_9SPHI|nr:hypothetical protein [Mucilaginibacter galii]GGI51211.1 hypothetical protein GCM10011425_24230 [Mucilaginibacter galii]
MEDNSYAVEQYCIVIASPQYFSSKIKLLIDFGKESGTNYDQQTDNEALNTMTSLVDALNYMSKQGWQLISSYTYNDPNKGSLQHYMMRKKVR